ncbi:hypothetical protein F4775DRAFT_539218 [Biscogniauxia sp. FL1348]|nr:hypothetical protein F4775DRAFT_539218 [Biscogniauxia sp. FL1348]
MPERKSAGNINPYRNLNLSPSNLSSSSSSFSFARPSLRRPPSPSPPPTRRRYRGHEVEDARRDVPQSLLLPYSLGTTTPGRQVLFHHQMVLRAVAPAPAPTPAPAPPPPAVLVPLKATGVAPEEGGEEEEESIALKQTATLKVQRWRDRVFFFFSDLKRRMKPASYPFAGFLFMIIVLVAAATVVGKLMTALPPTSLPPKSERLSTYLGGWDRLTVACILGGWYGLSKDTINHQSEPMPDPSITTRTAEPPALPGLRLSSHFTPAHGGAPPEMLGAGQLLEEAPPLVRAVPEDTTTTTAAAAENVLLATTTTTNTHIVTTTILVPPQPPTSSCTTCEDHDDDDNSPHASPPRTSTSTSTASPNTSSITAATITSTSTSSTDDASRTPATTTTSPELPPSSVSSSDAPTMTGVMYCLWPGRPHIYTLCPETHTRAPGMLDPTAGTPAGASSGGASSALRPPFVIVIIVALVSCLMHYPFPLFSLAAAAAAAEANATAMDVVLEREREMLLPGEGEAGNT